MTERSENTGTTPSTTQNNTANTPTGTAKPTQEQGSSTDRKDGTHTDQKERKDVEGKNTCGPAGPKAKYDNGPQRTRTGRSPDEKEQQP